MPYLWLDLIHSLGMVKPGKQLQWDGVEHGHGGLQSPRESVGIENDTIRFEQILTKIPVVIVGPSCSSQMTRSVSQNPLPPSEFTEILPESQ